MLVDFEQLELTQRYHLMTQTIIPRPVAWILSENKGDSAETSYNLAPFSYFNAVSSAPPLLMISLGKQTSGKQKDTSLNLKLGAKCVVHIPSTKDANSVTQTAASLEYGESEVDKLGLSLVEQSGFSLPRLRDCKIAHMCEVYDRKIIGDEEQNLIFLKIEKSYIDDVVCSKDSKGRLSINANMVDPLARLGANQYSGISTSFDLTRPK